MKIALYTHCYFPTHVYGTEVYVMNLARELVALGHEPHIVSAIFQGEPRQKNFIDEYEWAGVPVWSIDKNALPHRNMRETYEQPAMRAVHERMLRRLRPDVVHVCHLINHTTALIDAATVLNIPLFATLTDFFGFCLTNKLEAADGSLCTGPSPTRDNCIACHLKAVAAQTGRLRDQMLGRPPLRGAASKTLARTARHRPAAQIGSLRPADITERPDRLRPALAHYRAALAPTTILRDSYLANSFPAPLELSHFGLDIDRAPKPPSPDPKRIRLGYMGQIAPHKGVATIVQAMRESAQPNVSLTIWGDIEQDPAYIKTLRQLADGLPVRFAGRYPRDQVVSVLADIDIAVIPSTWYENSPQSLLEALATHTPVIVSDVAGLTEFVKDGVSGFVFPRGNASAMAAILRELGSHPERAAHLSLTTSYPRSLRHMAQDVLALYAAHGISKA